MALSLRFAEEADFSSRVVGIDQQSEEERPLAQAIFRWCKPVRDHLHAKGAAADVVAVDKLLVAMPGGPDKFVRELTSAWHTVATLVVSDELIQPCKLQSGSVSACVVLAKHAVDHADFGDVFAVRVPFAIPAASTWGWLQALQQHIHACETICLDAQATLTAYDSAQHDEPLPLLRELVTSAVSAATVAVDASAYPVRALEVPRFAAGIPAALITLGEVKRQHVRVLLAIGDFTTSHSEVAHCFAPLCSLLALDRPLFFKPQPDASEQDGIPGLYT